MSNIRHSRPPPIARSPLTAKQIIEEIRHSVFALRKLPPAEEAAARIVYHDAIKLAFAASGIFAVVSIVASFFANGKGLVRAQPHV